MPLRLVAAGFVLAIVGSPTTYAIAQCTFDGECNPTPFPSLCTRYRCINGQCAPPQPVDCNDHDACTIDGCSEQRAGCYHDPKCRDDGLACNGEERCCGNPIFCFIVGLCYSTDVDCGDGNPCTCESCAEPSGCQHVPINCDDGNLCTDDSCDPGAPGLADNCDAATICRHDLIPGCCRNAADCPDLPCRTGRLCAGNVCGEGTPRSCDDSDPLTVDGCDPETGCTHTTGTTLPNGGPCRVDADCPADADPCTIEACDPAAGCVSRPVTGFDSVACVCRRTDPVSCAATTVPRSVTTKRKRACTRIERAEEKPTRARKLLGRASKLLAAAQNRLGNAKNVDPSCQNDLSSILADGVARAVVLRDQL
jgi:hypothetical protein